MWRLISGYSVLLLLNETTESHTKRITSDILDSDLLIIPQRVASSTAHQVAVPDEDRVSWIRCPT